MDEKKVKQCRDEMLNIDIEDNQTAEGLNLLVSLVEKYGADVVAEAVEGSE
jgi:EAL domain-containing protein (putative c-di-GMP-specific phosphodiesterase class I)